MVQKRQITFHLKNIETGYWLLLIATSGLAGEAQDSLCSYTPLTKYSPITMYLTFILSYFRKTMTI